MRLLHESFNVVCLDSRIHFRAIEAMERDTVGRLDLTDWTTVLVAADMRMPILSVNSILDGKGVDVVT